MTMLREFRLPDPHEAEENLRVIRDLMERPTKHSTFSGRAGVAAGIAPIVGCLVTLYLMREHGAPGPIPFLITWSLVILTALTVDYLLTKRPAARVGKHILSHLGRQMFFAATPGLGTGTLLTLYFLRHDLVADIYPVWMLCYGIAVCSVAQFSRREVRYLGVAFLIAGAATLIVSSFGLKIGLVMTAVTFGGFHILYGCLMSRKDGW